MKTFIIAAILSLVAASAQAGLSGAAPPVAPVQKASVETNSVSVAKPVAKRVVKPVVKKKPRRKREDDDEIKIDID